MNVSLRHTSDFRSAVSRSLPLIILPTINLYIYIYIYIYIYMNINLTTIAHTYIVETVREFFSRNRP